MLVLGGSLHHRGGLEAFCERATTAVNRHAQGWRATWWTTDTAYLTPGRLGAAMNAWRRLGGPQDHAPDLVWLQWSTFADLLFLQRAVALGLPVMVTPHLGANARLQRIPALRALCIRLLERANCLALLFPGQEKEIALPLHVPGTVVGTFLPEIALSQRSAAAAPGPLRLIHAGRLGHGKGTFRMVALCAALRAQGVPFSARIVGRADAQTMAELGQAIATAELGGSLTLADWMDETALIAALDEADVLVHLSELDSFPLIVLEALAVGTIPIVADMTGARTMVEQYDGLVASGTDGGVAVAADWLAARNLSDLRHHAAELVERVRREQAWESGVARVMGAAEAALASRKPRVL
ncbi:Glycosyltransferase involved in cell wall bisynthesis [Novosphingobium sp. CF614]|nr:Glycosyltransferase involved in cell wall bisynthesis [Novosphingobium sp. CF614]